MAYLHIDEYGKHTVENVTKAEVARCREHDLLFPKENFKVTLRIKNNKKWRVFKNLHLRDCFL